MYYQSGAPQVGVPQGFAVGPLAGAGYQQPLVQRVVAGPSMAGSSAARPLGGTANQVSAVQFAGTTATTAQAGGTRVIGAAPTTASSKAANQVSAVQFVGTTATTAQAGGTRAIGGSPTTASSKARVLGAVPLASHSSRTIPATSASAARAVAANSLQNQQTASSVGASSVQELEPITTTRPISTAELEATGRFRIKQLDDSTPYTPMDKYFETNFQLGMQAAGKMMTPQETSVLSSDPSPMMLQRFQADFLARMQQLQQETIVVQRENVQGVWDQYDTDRNGILSEAECQQLCCDIMVLNRRNLSAMVQETLNQCAQQATVALEMEGRAEGQSDTAIRKMKEFTSNMMLGVTPTIQGYIEESLTKIEQDIPNVAVTINARMDRNRDGKVTRAEFEEGFMTASSELFDLNAMLGHRGGLQVALESAVLESKGKGKGNSKGKPR